MFSITRLSPRVEAAEPSPKPEKVLEEEEEEEEEEDVGVEEGGVAADGGEEKDEEEKEEEVENAVDDNAEGEEEEEGDEEGDDDDDDDDGVVVDLRAVATHDYTAEDDDEVSFKKGQKLHITFKSSWDDASGSGWYTGKVQH